MGKYSIHVKKGFSERKGLVKFSDIVQIDTLNIRTRNKQLCAECGKQSTRTRKTIDRK